MKVNSEMKKFIKNSKLSYRNIIEDINKKFKIKLAKSTISYYKRYRDRLVKLNIDNVDQKDMDWLKGFFVADGCKFIERKYRYVIKFALDIKNDKEILEKLAGILKQFGCRFSIRNDNSIIVVRIYSKMLFYILPTKNTAFVPRDPCAFLAGLIDGDGHKKGNSAVLVQYKNLQMMKHLSNLFGLKGSAFRVKTNYGNALRRQYYIPRNICDSIRQLSVKLNNNR
jgi:hypothetical protein